MDGMAKIVNSLMARPDAVPFREPVDWKGLGLYDYPQVISKPMDLITVKEGIDNSKYKSIDDCADDIRLIWSNMKTYNQDGSDIYKLADGFSVRFEERFAKLKAEYPAPPGMDALKELKKSYKDKSEDEVVAALEAAEPLDATECGHELNGLVHETVNRGHPAALRKVLELGGSPDGGVTGPKAVESLKEAQEHRAAANAAAAPAPASRDEPLKTPAERLELLKLIGCPEAAPMVEEIKQRMAGPPGPPPAGLPAGLPFALPPGILPPGSEVLSAGVTFGSVMASSRGPPPGVPVVNGVASRVSPMAVNGMFPIVTAVCKQDEACVRVLIEFGADVNGNSWTGLNPLQFVTQTVCLPFVDDEKRAANLRIADMLLDAGADANTVDMDGNPILATSVLSNTDGITERLVRHGADLERAAAGGPHAGLTPLALACGVTDKHVFAMHDGVEVKPTDETVMLLVRLGAKLEPPKLVEREATGAAKDRCLPETCLKRRRRTYQGLADMVRFIIDGGGDAAEPNSAATPEALARRVALVDEFETAAATFEYGDLVVIHGLVGKPKYNNKVAKVCGRITAKLRFPVTVEMRESRETIALKIANLRPKGNA